MDKGIRVNYGKEEKGKEKKQEENKKVAMKKKREIR